MQIKRDNILFKFREISTYFLSPILFQQHTFSTSNKGLKLEKLHGMFNYFSVCQLFNLALKTLFPLFLTPAVLVFCQNTTKIRKFNGFGSPWWEGCTSHQGEEHPAHPHRWHRRRPGWCTGVWCCWPSPRCRAGRCICHSSWPSRFSAGLEAHSCTPCISTQKKGQK